MILNLRFAKHSLRRSRVVDEGKYEEMKENTGLKFAVFVFLKKKKKFIVKRYLSRRDF